MKVRFTVAWGAMEPYPREAGVMVTPGSSSLSRTLTDVARLSPTFVAGTVRMPVSPGSR